LKDVGIKGGFRKKWQRRMKALKRGGKQSGLLNKQQMGLLKEICLKPETWQKFENEQAKAATEGMEAISTVMGNFFHNMQAAVKQSGRMLEFNQPPTSQQMMAIELFRNKTPGPENDDEEKASTELKAIKDVANSEVRDKWVEGSECEVFSSTLEKWCNATIVAIHKDSDEWLQVVYEGNSAETGSTKELERYSKWIRPRVDVLNEEERLKLHSAALMEAAQSKLNVTQQMMQEFTANSQTQRALTLAEGVEDCCKHLMTSHGTVRESLLLARAIWKLKPANMDNDKCKALWEVVDAGAVRLMDSALKMAKASADFFGYFLRFQHSFQYFKSNKEKSLTVSLRDLREDCRNFTSFKSGFMKQVDELNNEAMRVITNCVKKQCGDEAFESARAKREELQRIYLDAKEEWDRKEVTMDLEFSKLQSQMVDICKAKARAEAEIANLNSTIEQRENELKQFNEILVRLEEQITV